MLVFGKRSEPSEIFGICAKISINSDVRIVHKNEQNAHAHCIIGDSRSNVSSQRVQTVLFTEE